MTDNTRRLAYLGLKDRNCPECDISLDFQVFEIKKVENSLFEAEYNCPNCGENIDISIQLKNDRIATEFSKGGKTLFTAEPSIGTVLERGHDARQWIERIYELADVLKILSTNLERFEQIESRLPKWFEDGLGLSIEELELHAPTPITADVGRTELRGILLTEVHNYLAAAYSFDQLIETIQPDVIWSGEIEQEFQRYKRNSKVVLGLRHYVQHEGVLPMEFRLNTTGSERQVDILTDLDTVSSMDSQVSVERPDGYRKGANYYYGELAGDSINISAIIREHMIESHELGMSIIEKIRDSYGDKIEEFEEFQDLHIHPDDIDPREFPDLEE